MNFIVMRLLCDQFDELNEEFGKSVGDRGEFHGNFEQFRRRHHAICRSVQEADRFLMISNVGCFGCNIASLITVLFSSIFYPQDTLSSSPWDAVMYVCWLVLNVLSLTMAVGMAILVNCKVNTVFSIYTTRCRAITGRTARCAVHFEVSEADSDVSAVQGHPRSLISVPIINAYATSY